MGSKTVLPYLSFFQKTISHFTHGIATYILLPVCFDLCAGAGFIYKMGMVQWEECFGLKKHLEHKTDLEQ